MCDVSNVKALSSLIFHRLWYSYALSPLLQLTLLLKPLKIKLTHSKSTSNHSSKSVFLRKHRKIVCAHCVTLRESATVCNNCRVFFSRPPVVIFKIPLIHYECVFISNVCNCFVYAIKCQIASTCEEYW